MRVINGITELTIDEALEEIWNRKLEIDIEGLSKEFMNVWELFKISIKEEDQRILDLFTDKNRQTEADENGIAELYPKTDIIEVLKVMLDLLDDEIDQEALKHFTIYKEEE